MAWSRTRVRRARIARGSGIGHAPLRGGGQGARARRRHPAAVQVGVYWSYQCWHCYLYVFFLNCRVTNNFRPKRTNVFYNVHWMTIISVSTAISSNGRDLTVDFPQQPGWTGQVSEMELVTDQCKYSLADVFLSKHSRVAASIHSTTGLQMWQRPDSTTLWYTIFYPHNIHAKQALDEYIEDTNRPALDCYSQLLDVELLECQYRLHIMMFYS